MFSLRFADNTDTSVFSEKTAQWQLIEKHLQYWEVICLSTSDISGSLTAWSQDHKVQALFWKTQNWFPQFRALQKTQGTVLFKQCFPNLDQ